MELRLPVKDVAVNQPFGMNYVNFYQINFNPPLLGHPGIDFKAKTGACIYAAHNGVVLWSGVNMPDGGKMVSLWNKTANLKTIYYHLDNWTVEAGQQVKAGDIIGHADNTGKMTTGSHLHFEVKGTDYLGNTTNRNNGYGGAIDPSPFFRETYNGLKISNKDWYKSRSYHRYYRPDTKRNLANEMKTALYIARRLKRLPNNEEINMAIWGGWDIESIMNPAMYEITSQLKKSEYLEGQKPFN